MDSVGCVGLVDSEVLEYMVSCREQGRSLPRFRPQRNPSPWHRRTATASNTSSAAGEFYYNHWKLCYNTIMLLFVGMSVSVCLSVCLLHTHTTHNCFTALWILSGTTRVSRCQKKDSPTHTHRGHQSSLSAFSIYYDTWYPPYSMHVLYSLFPQSLSKFSLVYLLAFHPPLHTPYISSPSRCLLFATHALTVATCFAKVQHNLKTTRTNFQ